MSRHKRKTEFSPGLVKPRNFKELLGHIPLRRIDKLLIMAAVGIALYGTLMIYSATHAGDNPLHYLQKQLIFLVIALIAMVLGTTFDYRKLMSYSRVIYGVSIILLLVVLVFPAKGGSHRWIPLLLFDLQPSELVKLAVIVMLATMITDRRSESCSNLDFLKALGIVLVPVFLVFVEPDLGTSISIFIIFLFMIIIGGARLKQVSVLGVGTIGAAAVLIQFGLLKTYQLNRLMVFIKPDLDPLHAGYNLTQSKIAIGSGQLFGKGLFQGTQTNLKFIPAHHTDFIFSVVGEELGFIGAAMLLGLFGLLIWRGFKIALTAKEPFGMMMATGILIMLFFQIMVNIGMAIGIMPVTGITLPFMSYGGSSLILNFFCVGLLVNIGMRRFPQGS
ncbi:MAG: rod shape-determining protein RodA [Actinobacteria bacterium]|nr:rod shape-determining protein RodA [Actinomycetota bacterium]